MVSSPLFMRTKKVQSEPYPYWNPNPPRDNHWHPETNDSAPQLQPPAAVNPVQSDNRSSGGYSEAMAGLYSQQVEAKKAIATKSTVVKTINIEIVIRISTD